MGKPTGFLEYRREQNGDIPVKERIKNFEEFHIPISDKARREQAARCMNCGVPLCQSAVMLHGMVTGCPLHNLIPEYNDHLYRGHYEHALARLTKTNNFPEFTGRVCPALCEKACINGEYGEPVTCHDNELFLIETGFENGYIRPQIPAVRSGKKVAVVGSGPSGLEAADQLNHRGHSVTVFEREDRIGGLLMYGIPNMKLDKSVIERRRKLMEKEGVTFRTGVNVGADGSAADLLRDYDAVILCCGAKEPRKLQAKGMDGSVKGIEFAVSFLTENTRRLLSPKTGSKNGISAAGRDVVVVGGGDTGNDCIGTVIRQGCHSVTALEMMPEPPAERSADNPWPEWPRVKKTDYGHEEAIAKFGHDPRIYSTTVKEVHADKKGELKSITTVQVKMENGKMTEIPGTEKELPCSLLLIAAGFTGCEKYTADAFGVSLTRRGTARTEEGGYKTGVDKVFAAGDMHRGQSLVVWAIHEGRCVAREVDGYLMGYSNEEE